jgi:hypothetical protein
MGLKKITNFADVKANLINFDTIAQTTTDRDLYNTILNNYLTEHGNLVNKPGKDARAILDKHFSTPFYASAPMMYGVYPALAALAARSLYNNYYASGGKTKKRSQRKRQTRKRQ